MTDEEKKLEKEFNEYRNSVYTTENSSVLMHDFMWFLKKLREQKSISSSSHVVGSLLCPECEKPALERHLDYIRCKECETYYEKAS